MIQIFGRLGLVNLSVRKIGKQMAKVLGVENSPRSLFQRSPLFLLIVTDSVFHFFLDSLIKSGNDFPAHRLMALEKIVK
jgi:hypothetical protein